MGIENQELEIPESGLVVVLGFNQTSTAFESIGSGKTGLGEAISKTLLNIGRGSASEDDEPVSAYSRNELGNTLVQVYGTLDSTPFEVELGYKHKSLNRTGEGLRFKVGQDTICKSHLNLTREELFRVVNVSQEIAPWTVFIDGKSLNIKRTGQGRIVKLLMSALGQPSWETIHQRTKAALNELEAQCSIFEAALESATDRVGRGRESIESARKQVAEETQQLELEKRRMESELETLDSRLTGLNEAVSAAVDKKTVLKAKIRKVEEDSAEIVHKHEIHEQELRDAVATISKSREPIHGKVGRLRLEKQHADSTLSELLARPTICPKCKQPWNNGPSESDVKQARSSVKSAESRLEEVELSLQESTSKLKEAQKKVEESVKESREFSFRGDIRRMSDELSGLDDAIDTLKRQVLGVSRDIDRIKLGPNNTALTRAKTTLEERERHLNEATEDETRSKAELGEERQLANVVNYWSIGFSPVGIPNLVLKNSIDPLNQISHELSHRLSCGVLGVQFETNRELASGNIKNELTVNVRNKMGSKRLSSNGESGLVNLIVAETLSEVGQVSNRIGWRWYDEVINSQDRIVRQGILSYLKEMASRLQIPIFIVDHHPESANFADHILVATKSKEGITTYHWQ